MLVMLAISAETLARIQFAFTVSFHIIFPAFSIGLSSYLMVLNALWLIKGDGRYLALFEYWKKIFTIAFGMGVVSGVVMSYQFGTNWSVFADKAGPVIGPLMAYEVLSAFFLEAGFLGIMLFGRDRVGPKLHMFAVAMVALGTLISATWILSVNSWMQTPQGYSTNAEGQFIAESWKAVIFNPSFPYRLVHMVLAAYLTTAFVVAGVGAFHLLKDRENMEARLMFSMAMWMAVLVTPIQLIAGDQQGLNTQKYQPVKIMGMEGHYDSYPDGAPLVLIGWPDSKEAKVKYAIEIPKLGSLIVMRDANAPMEGLKTVPREDWPPVWPIFWSFRIMVGMGLIMLGMGFWGLIRRGQKKLYDSPWLFRFSVLTGPAGFIALLAGWFTTEMGRQPFTIYGLLRTADSASPLEVATVGTTLLIFICAYFFVFGTGISYIFHLMRQAPRHHETTELLGPTRAGGVAGAEYARSQAKRGAVQTGGKNHGK